MSYAPIAFARLAAVDADERPGDLLGAVLSAGAQGLEVDIAGGDGAVVLPGRGRARRRRSEPAPALVLSEVCERIPAGCVLSVGVEDEATVRAAELVATGYAGPLWLRSSSVDVLEQLALRIPVAIRVHTTEPDRVKVPLERHAHVLHSIGAGAVRLPHDAWSAGLVALFHRFGVRTVASEASEVRHVRAVLAMGIDAVAGDRADRLVAAIGEFALRETP